VYKCDVHAGAVTVDIKFTNQLCLWWHKLCCCGTSSVQQFADKFTTYD